MCRHGYRNHTALKKEKIHKNVQTLTHKPTQRVNRSKQVGGRMNVNMPAKMATKDSKTIYRQLFRALDCESGDSTEHLVKVREDVWVGGDNNPRGAEQEAI